MSRLGERSDELVERVEGSPYCPESLQYSISDSIIAGDFRREGGRREGEGVNLGED